MALRMILNRRKQEQTRARLAAIGKKEAELRARRAALKKREDELEKALDELDDAASEADKQAIEAETDQFTADDTALTKEEQQVKQDRMEAEKELADLAKEMIELEAQQTAAEQAAADEEPDSADDEEEENRSMNKRMTRSRRFDRMSGQQRSAIVARREVKDFLTRVRAMKGQTRAVTGAELLIPTVVLDLVRPKVEETSKLMKHVRVRHVPGKARQNVMGTIPEAVWTEMVANINEVALAFNGVEMDGYKVAAYVPVPNSILEDASDVALASEIIDALGRAIGLALDKAILYGTGTRMPQGIVTRLAQTAKPSDYSDDARAWDDLHASNIVSIATSKKGVALFQEIITASGSAKGKYASGERFFAMNEVTFNKLQAEALNINAAGMMVSAMEHTMPVLGGAVEELEFIPDNVIIGGYGELYLLCERAGTDIAVSDQYRFIEDQTVYRATARYDGTPVIAEGFVAIGLNGVTPAADAVTFAEDKANKADSKV